MCLYNENTRAERSILRGQALAPPWDQLWATGLGLPQQIHFFFSQFFLFTKVTPWAFGSGISPKPNSGHKNQQVDGPVVVCFGLKIV